MSGSPGLSGSARPVTAAQKSAEGIVAGSPAKARTTDRVSRTATLMRTRRQNIQLELALDPAAKGEARSPDTQGTEARTAHAEPERPAAGQQPLMEAVVEPPARPRIRRRRPCRLTPSNRRVRTRTHGGVGGEEPRGSPLSRLRYGPAGDSAPRLRLKAAWYDRKVPFRPGKHGPNAPFSLVSSASFGSARSRLGREAAKRTLDGEDRSGTIKREGKGGASLLFGGPNRTVRGPVPVPKSYRVPS